MGQRKILRLQSLHVTQQLVLDVIAIEDVVGQKRARARQRFRVVVFRERQELAQSERQRVFAGETVTFETRHRRKDGTLLDVDQALSRFLPAQLAQLRKLLAAQPATLKDLPAGLIVTSGRGIHGPQMAELAFYYMIALSRNVRGMLENQERRKWERWPQRLLLGKTASLVGVGAISEEIAVRCQAFGMTTIGVSDSRMY